MAFQTAKLLLFSFLFYLYTKQCNADVSSLRRSRFEANPMPYPAAGYQPDRHFSLPGDSDSVIASETQQHRPDATYGAPARYSVPSQRLYVASASHVRAAPQVERLFVMPRKSARLAAAPGNREDTADVDDVDDDSRIVSDIEVDAKAENEQRAIVANPQPSTVYYPAGAVNFVQPLGAAYVQPANAQPAAYIQPAQFAAQLQAHPATFIPAAQSKVNVQPAAAAPAAAVQSPTLAKLETNPAAETFMQPATPTTATLAPPGAATVFASPATTFTYPYPYSTVAATTAALTASPFLQSQQFYASPIYSTPAAGIAPAIATPAQLQAW